MLDELVYLFVTLIITFTLYPLWINFVYKYHMGEDIRKEGPKTHLVKKGTPTMGGLVFILTVAAVTLIFNRSRTQTLLPIFVAAMAGAFGVIEDLSKIYKTSGLRELLLLGRKKIKADSTDSKPFVERIWPLNKLWAAFKEASRIVGSTASVGLDTYQKFLIQFAIGGFVAYWTYFKLGWDYIWFPLVGNVHVGIFYPIFIFFLFLAVLNFVAFTDGLDGLAGGLSLIAFAAYWVIASQLGYYSLSILAATFIGALIPFLYFNIFPARIFMGNVGSHVLGAALVVFSVMMHREIAMLIILLVFLIDGISSPLQSFTYKFTRKRLFRMAPLHHHFEELGWPESKVTLRFWLFGVFFGLLGIFVALM